MVTSNKIKRITLLLSLFGLSLALLGATTAAITTSISKGYKTKDAGLVTGMAASLSSESTDQERLVEGATTANADRFVGIITTVDDSLVTFSGGSTDVLVSTEGEVSGFVSDLNGEIKTGDFVSLSPLRGILMKSDDNRENRVVAVALQDSADIPTDTKEISTSQGSQTYKIGKLKLEISQSIVVNATESEQKSGLVLAGESITGKSVGQAQVLAALVIFAVVLIVEGSIIYGAIHSSVTALGRNPLAKKAVFRQLLQVSWIALVVLVAGFGAIYVILWI